MLIFAKAHIGTMGNELVDSLAKQATSLNYIENDVFSSYTKSYFRIILQNYMTEFWQSIWDVSDKGRFTYKFLPMVSTFFFFFWRGLLFELVYY